MKLDFSRLTARPVSHVSRVSGPVLARVSGATPAPVSGVSGVGAAMSEPEARHLRHLEKSEVSGLKPSIGADSTPATPATPEDTCNPAEHLDTREAFEERAAIREFDGGQKRAEAEHAARCEAACRHCRRRQPTGQGYCCGRSDLPPVYGDSHPLRHLPADLGANCPRFEPEASEYALRLADLQVRSI